MADAPGEPHVPGEAGSRMLSAGAVERDGRWWVELVVAFPDGVVSRLVGPYLSQQKAAVAAHFIARGAGSDRPPHPGL